MCDAGNQGRRHSKHQNETGILAFINSKRDLVLTEQQIHMRKRVCILEHRNIETYPVWGETGFQQAVQVRQVRGSVWEIQIPTITLGS